MRRGSEASGGSSESFFGSLLSRRRIRHLVAALILLAFCLASGRAFGLFGGWSSASVDRVDAVLQPQLSLIVSSDAPTVAPPIVPDAETGDDGEENALFAEVQTLVPVSLHVMSRCPDAAVCQGMFSEVLRQVGDIVDLRTEFITKDEAGTDCLHGTEECIGNQYELCARSVAGSASGMNWFDFGTCLHGQRSVLSGADLCAPRSNLRISDIRACVLTRGSQLLKESAAVSRSRRITRSCTIWMEDHIVCIRDGRWYDCPGGHEVSDFVRMICKAYKGPAPPPACKGLK